MPQRMLITGGAGFIGINAARHFIAKGWEVTLFDNFSRKGTEVNVRHLEEDFLGKFRVVKGDVRCDRNILEREVSEHDVVLHLAAQVAVTTSITDPRSDFETNALGTFNVLEAVRISRNRPFVLYTSTNKVYGSLEEHEVLEEGKRYRFKDDLLCKDGVSEKQNLDFHSPYGVSKGVADQYTIDYSRIYGLKTVVMRQSCIYGVHQFGVEDQGWVAWLTIAAMLGKSISIYGNGKQVRDLLYVGDLIDLYECAIAHQDIANGKAYNVGGGPKNTLSLLELFDLMKNEVGYDPSLSYAPIRAGDQPVFIADIGRAKTDFKWEPKIDPLSGFRLMHKWMLENRQDIQDLLG